MKNIISILVAVAVLAFSQVTFAAEEVSSIARGGKLYDKWFKVIGAPKPSETHPAWPASNTKKKGNATHRCKACHGWDLMGKDGAYASGSYKTGIPGLKNMQGASNSKVISAMKDSTHGFAGKMADQDFTDLANFVTKGTIRYRCRDRSQIEKSQRRHRAGRTLLQHCLRRLPCKIR